MTTAANPKRILVAEDDESIAFLTRFMLERERYAVTLAADGREASRIIAGEAAPDLAILDLMLPFTDGYALLRMIRSKPEWSAVPVIILTAKSQERDIVRALDAGANDYVVKPFQPDELLARVRRLLKAPA